MKPFILLISFLSLASCMGNDCEKLKQNYNSYFEAISKIRNTGFSIEEKVNTDSSWIESIEYYSCDKKKGYLIMTTLKGKSYIHSGVPFEVWEEFKNASSIGSYYNNIIKSRYYFNLNN